jgi:hypothetical protein
MSQYYYPDKNQITIKIGDGYDSIPIPNLQKNEYKTIDIGQDKNLQNNITKFFYDKVNKWISSYPDFKHLKKHSKYLKGTHGMDYIHNILKLFIKKSKANWYDLKDKANYDTVKDFLKYKIGNV